VRLASIDCPEKGQPFSNRAKQFTSDLVFGKTVKVDPVTTDRFGRTVAWIYVDGVNVSHEIVKSGMGWWFPKYAPHDNLLEELEEKAREKEVGSRVEYFPARKRRIEQGGRQHDTGFL
jgi:micrococcal nuclease